jgi:glycerophosphoryl diester phosphodiesterase
VENTLAAFRRAREEGADGVELDVLSCATGEVVVFHDEDLTRLAGRPERIADLPLAAVRDVRLAGGQSIPLFTEALEELGSQSMLVNVEIKAPPPAASPGRWD